MARSKITNPQISFDQSAGSSGYIKIGGVMFQWGATAANVNGTYQAWPVAFSGTPRVVVNLNDPGTQDARAYNITATGATMRQNYGSSNLEVQWLAIGPA